MLACRYEKLPFLTLMYEDDTMREERGIDNHSVIGFTPKSERNLTRTVAPVRIRIVFDDATPVPEVTILPLM